MFITNPLHKKQYAAIRDLLAENLLFKSCLPISPEFPYRALGAYTRLHSLLDYEFLPKPALNTILRARASSAWLRGYTIEESPLKEKSEIFREFFNSLQDKSGTLSMKEWEANYEGIKDSLSKCLALLERTTNATYLAWRFYPLITTVNTLSYSTKWHYDLQVQQDYPYMMVYFNEPHEQAGGTEILSASQSESLSNTTGYIAHLKDRVESLKDLELSIDENEIAYCNSSIEKCLIFWPSRSLHRGVLPKQMVTRQAIHLSFIPVSDNSSFSERVHSSLELCKEQIGTHDSLIPFYTYKPPIGEKKSIVWTGRLTEFRQVDLLNNCIFRETSLGSVYSHSDRDFDPFVDLASYFQNLRPNLSEPQTAELNYYMTGVSKEIGRYSNLPRSHVFWPNQDHDKYPANINNIFPFTRRKSLIAKGTPLGSAGSCFAVEISKHFQRRGFNYIITESPPTDEDRMHIIDYSASTSDYVQFSANYGIHFNSKSLLQLAQRAFGKREFKRILFHGLDQDGRDVFLDPYRENIYFDSVEAYEEDYEKHTLAIRKLLCTAKVFIFTLGLNECWQFRDDQTVISRNPRAQHAYQLLEHKTMDIEDHVGAIEQFLNIVRMQNPDFQLILTLSPIPLLATGNAEHQHVVEANTYGKSIQRVAIQRLLERDNGIHYFPSYEYVTECIEDPWERDRRHINKEALEKIMNFFEEVYCT